MDREKNPDRGGKRTERRSFIGGLYNRFLNFLYSMIVDSAIGRFIISDHKPYLGSSLRKYAASKNIGRSSRTFEGLNAFFSRSRVILFLKKMTLSALSMSISVYAIYFTVYGVASALINYTLIFIDSGKGYGIRGVITGGVITLLSIPLLTSFRSLKGCVANSFVGGRIVRSFFMIPEENLITKKRIGSTAHMLIFAALGLASGALTYFVHPIVVPLVFIAFILFLVIMSYPEAGVMTIAVTAPFLHYSNKLSGILTVLVIVTCISFAVKVCSGRRIGRQTTAGVIIALFCVFMIMASFLTAGGWQTFLDGIHAVVFVLGGFHITYSLMKSEEKLRICTKAVMASFGVLVFMGIWELIYGGGGADILRHSWKEMGSIIADHIFYVADSASNFGIIASMICPLLFASAISKKSVSGTIISFICFGISIVATLIYGTYESLIVIVIGVVIYTVFHSRRSLAIFISMCIIVSLSVSIIFAVIPENISDRVIHTAEKFIPVHDPATAIRDEINADTWEMIKDGHIGGIGVGEHAFKEAIAPYTSEVTKDATAPSNLYLQIICWSGIGGLLVFIAAMAWVFKKAIGYMLITTNEKMRRTVLAFSCGLISVLILGMVTNIWSDIRIFYLFWMIVSLLCAHVKLGLDTEERKSLGNVCESDRIDINLRFGD